ncbi:MAG: hypothetical protein ACXAAI_14655 [Promethearchaeota archaeon]|jgi:hypothetical protein
MTSEGGILFYVGFISKLIGYLNLKNFLYILGAILMACGGVVGLIGGILQSREQKRK